MAELIELCPVGFASPEYVRSDFRDEQGAVEEKDCRDDNFHCLVLCQFQAAFLLPVDLTYAGSVPIRMNLCNMLFLKIKVF